MSFTSIILRVALIGFVGMFIIMLSLTRSRTTGSVPSSTVAMVGRVSRTNSN